MYDRRSEKSAYSLVTLFGDILGKNKHLYQEQAFVSKIILNTAQRTFSLFNYIPLYITQSLQILNIVHQNTQSKDSFCTWSFEEGMANLKFVGTNDTLLYIFQSKKK